MPIYFGNNKVAPSGVDKVYYGSNLVYEKTQPVAYTGLCLTANTPGSTVGVYKAGTTTVTDLEYSRDGVHWYTPATIPWESPGPYEIVLQSAGDKVYFRNNTNYSTLNYISFKMTGSISASGNCNSMVDATNFETLTSLPCPYCLMNLFYECTSLTSAPELPATDLHQYCYANMFYGCTNLTDAPYLPAPSIAAPFCYSWMFYGCSSLNHIKSFFDDWKKSQGGYLTTDQWVYGVAPTGTFECRGLSGELYDESHIPTGWTRVIPYSWTITTAVDPVGGGTVTGSGTYVDGTTYTITATANEGYVFDHWLTSGGTTYTQPTITFIAEMDSTYTAYFTEEAQTYTWTITSSTSTDTRCRIMYNGTGYYTKNSVINITQGDSLTFSTNTSLYGKVIVDGVTLQNKVRKLSYTYTPTASARVTITGNGSTSNPYTFTVTSI